MPCVVRGTEMFTTPLYTTDAGAGAAAPSPPTTARVAALLKWA
jgi:hypothetical protein